MASIDAFSRSPLLNEILAPRDSSFVIVEWTAEPAAPNAPREYIAPVHIHHDDDEAWYVLEGTLGFLFDGEEINVPAGGAAYARAGVAHTYWNAGTTPARYLILMPRRVHDLIGALHDPARGERSFADTFHEFHSELIDDSARRS